MNKCSILLTGLILLFACASLNIARADDVASNYLHLRNNLGSRPGAIADLMADENSDRQTARYYELSGRIDGQVNGAAQSVVMLQCGTASVDITASQSFLLSTDWMDSGSVIRALVKSVPSSNGDVGAPELVLIAAGPEDNISALEKSLAAQDAQIQASEQSRRQGRLLQETSRSSWFPMRFQDSSGPVQGLSQQASSIYPAYFDRISQLNPRLSVNDVAKITTSILFYSEHYQIDPRLIVAMMVAESGFDPYSVSSTGAAGLGQLMPETAAELGVTNAFDPVQNIAGSVALLKSHVQRYGGTSPCGVVPLNTLLLSMAAYNAGPGAVEKYGGVPPYRETQNYVRKVDQIYRQLCGT
jgi:soluble lytic murein transglycosylase-like protein